MQFKCSDIQVLDGIEKLSLLINKMIFISHLSHKKWITVQISRALQYTNDHLMMFVSFQVQNNYLRTKKKNEKKTS